MKKRPQWRQQRQWMTLQLTQVWRQNSARTSQLFYIRRVKLRCVTHSAPPPTHRRSFCTGAHVRVVVSTSLSPAISLHTHAQTHTHTHTFSLCESYRSDHPSIRPQEAPGCDPQSLWHVHELLRSEYREGDGARICIKCGGTITSQVPTVFRLHHWPEAYSLIHHRWVRPIGDVVSIRARHISNVMVVMTQRSNQRYSSMIATVAHQVHAQFTSKHLECPRHTQATHTHRHTQRRNTHTHHTHTHTPAQHNRDTHTRHLLV